MHFVNYLPRWAFLLTLCVLAGAAGIATAQVKQGKSRALKTSQLMKGIVKPHCDALKKGVVEAAPDSDEAWQKMAVNAAVLNEISYMLMDDGRCPDEVWADASTKKLRNGSTALLRAIEGKDAAGAKTAYGSLMQSCKACHEKHKPK